MDAPGENRRQLNFKRMTLTDIKIDIGRCAGKKVLTQAFKDAGKLKGRTLFAIQREDGVQQKPPRSPLTVRPPPKKKTSRAADVAGKFAASSWGKKLASRAAKAKLNDFDRFKAVVQRVRPHRSLSFCREPAAHPVVAEHQQGLAWRRFLTHALLPVLAQVKRGRVIRKAVKAAGL